MTSKYKRQANIIFFPQRSYLCEIKLLNLSFHLTLYVKFHAIAKSLDRMHRHEHIPYQSEDGKLSPSEQAQQQKIKTGEGELKAMTFRRSARATSVPDRNCHTGNVTRLWKLEKDKGKGNQEIINKGNDAAHRGAALADAALIWRGCVPREFKKEYDARCGASSQILWEKTHFIKYHDVVSRMAGMKSLYGRQILT